MEASGFPASIPGARMPAAEEQLPEDSLFLFDGSALAYRSHFAMERSGLSSPDGVPTGATFGFATELRRILERVRPRYAASVFDTPEPTFRHEMYPEYKATRQKMPPELVEQLPFIHEAAEVLGTRVLRIDGYEADDVIGTLAVSAAARGIPVYIVTGDKDFMQLVSSGISLYNVMKKGEQVAVLGPEEVKEQFGVPPPRVVDVLALMGDSSDNVPGVPGIGKKTASNLVARFGGLEDVLKNASLAGGKRVVEGLTQHADQAWLSRRLVTIHTDVPLEVDVEDLRYEGPRTGSSLELFRRLGFSTLAEEMSRLGGEARKPGGDYHLVDSREALEDLMERMREADLVAFDTETDSLRALRARAVGLSFAMREGEAFYVPLNRDPPLIPEEDPGDIPGTAVMEALRPLLESEQPSKCAQNAKYDILVLRRFGIDVRGLGTDTMVASHLVEPQERERNLDALSMRHFGHGKIKTEELIGTGRSQITMDLVPVEQLCAYACEDADFTLRLADLFLKRLDEVGVRKLHDEVEIPLVSVLADMEEAGVRVDRSILETMAQELDEQVRALEGEIHELAGRPFNVQSPRQLGRVLFEEMAIHEELAYKPRKTKTGWATGQAVLEELADHALPRKILEHRALTKLLNTYVRPLPSLVDERTGRIHTSYNQAVAATGRLSSSEPNLQNIPIRSPTGRRIREAFLPTSDAYLLLSADYSQIELRILAHLSGDESLIEAFRNDVDIHRDTASRVFRVPPDQVDAALRSRAKAINFGILYGMGPQRLSRETDLSLGEAREFIGRYFETFPAVRELVEGLKEQARAQGYVSTLLGRRRPIPDIGSSNGMLRSQAENMAVNTPIQGSAADILKLAMVRIHSLLEARSGRSRMILTVHDELVFDVWREELEEVRELVVREMEQAYPLAVPIRVDVGSGSTWLEAH